jgi:sortase (surface protein transpeptidase)
MANDRRATVSKKRPFISDRALLIGAVTGLSITTGIVLLFAGLFVASLFMRWPPDEPQPTMQVLTPATAVSISTATAVVAVQNEPLPERPQKVATPELENQGILSNQLVVAVPQAPAVATANETAPDPSLGRLIIPALNINRSIATVPLQSGQWDISNLSTEIGHLTSTGDYPGDDVAMTFIGHVTVPWPGTAPFAELIFLEHGEDVIYRWNGTDYIYQVERIFRAHPTNVDLLFEMDGSRIHLVTCSGWDFIDRQYDERLVTRAVLVRQEPSPPVLEQ